MNILPKSSAGPAGSLLSEDSRSREPRLQFEDGRGGVFTLSNADRVTGLYFPLANDSGMMSCVTPQLGGDVKTGQSSFLLTPVSVEDLHLSRGTRNFWLFQQDAGAWSACGVSAAQTVMRTCGEEICRMEAGFLWQTVVRENRSFGLRSEVTTFVPEKETVELTRVRITNISGIRRSLVPTAAIPVFARPADNLRDHRHVTSLLHRIHTERFGVVTEPTLIFDERGHRRNHTVYTVLGACGDGTPPVGFFPLLHPFLGEGGTLDWPEAVTENRSPDAAAGFEAAGEEALGGLRFQTVELEPGESAEYILALGINSPNAVRYLSSTEFQKALSESQKAWEKKTGIRFSTGDRDFDLWMRWVVLEPAIRHIFGCSFLPHHDYGHGGRGWRDLWQDCLTLLLTDGSAMAEPLWQFCAGMRFDGTNATIIGDEGGNVRFIADRNNIARVWMDHAAWPLRTIALYLDETGDLDFLLRRQTYFYDGRVMRCRETDPDRDAASGTELPVKSGGIWRGTILEHLLLEALTACCDVGEHGMLRLENADWNDALDMAAERGESVAFSSMYAGNLKTLAGFLRALAARGTETVELAAELIELTNGLQNEETPDRMQERLNHFCASCRGGISGDIAVVNTEDLAGLLEQRASRLAKRIRQQEQVTDGTYRWLNGYYDNDGLPVERGKPEVRMTLTGQVFALRYGVADQALAKDIAAAADHYLFAPELGGYRLNTDFHELKLNLGRQFGFAYGHKENGSVFSHMAVMYANALYHRGMVKEGRRALAALIDHSMDFSKSRIYPGIPEYFGPDGRGMYHYLTGAASWLALTLRCEVFGISGRLGNLFLSPKLTAEDFANSGSLSCETYFLGRHLRVSYRNLLRLDYGEYAVGSVLLDGNPASPIVRKDGCAMLHADTIRSLNTKNLHTLDAELTFNGQK